MQEEAASEEAASEQRNQELRQKEEEAGRHSERSIHIYVEMYASNRAGLLGNNRTNTITQHIYCI